jgi:hypothetical protein
MTSAAELKLQRRNTAAFIDANPTTLVLIPRTRQRDGVGARFVDGNPRPPQVLRLIDQSTELSPRPGVVQTSDGRERLIDFMLLGRHDATIGLWDYWTDLNGTWEVAQVFPPNGYEVRAAVVRHA